MIRSANSGDVTSVSGNRVMQLGAWIDFTVDNKAGCALKAAPRDYLRARVNAYKQSPAPTTIYCLSSSIHEEGPLLTGFMSC